MRKEKGKKSVFRGKWHTHLANTHIIQKINDEKINKLWLKNRQQCFNDKIIIFVGERNELFVHEALDIIKHQFVILKPVFVVLK